MTDNRPASLLVQVSPYETAEQLGAWNPASIIPAGQVTLSTSNTDARRTASSGGDWAEVRGIEPIAGSKLVYWETQLREAVSGQFEAMIGIACDGLAPLAMFAGANDGGYSVGLDPSGGRLRYKGEILSILPGISTSVRIRHLLNLSSYTYSVAVGAGGFNDVTLEPLLMGFPWRPIAQMSAIANRGWRIYDGSDSFEFLHALPPGAVPYRHTVHAPHYLHITSGRFPMGISGGVPRSFWPGRICADQDVEFSLSARSWVHGGMSSGRRGQIVLANPRGELDHWLPWRWRGVRVQLKRAREGDDYSAYQPYATGVVDRLEPLAGTNGTRLAIVMRDLNAGNDVQLQRRTYPVNHANPQARERPRPITIGRPLYCEGVLQSTANVGADAFAIEFHDGWRDHNTAGGALDSVSAVYDRGDVFDPPPTDWGYWPASGPRRGVKLVNEPDGKVVGNPVGPGDPFSIEAVWEQLRNVIYMLYTRGQGYWDGTLSLASLDALQMVSPGLLAAYITDPITAEAAIAQALTGATGFLAPTRSGSLVAGRLQDPEPMTPVAELTLTNIIELPPRVLDTAPNLSARMAGRRNHSPYNSDGDIATSVGPALRQELTKEWGVIRGAASVLHPTYAHAINAPPQPTWLQNADDIQREINRVCHLYSVQRFWYPIKVFDNASTAAINPGVAVRVRYPNRYGLTNGRNLLVKDMIPGFFKGRMSLQLWGA